MAFHFTLHQFLGVALLIVLLLVKTNEVASASRHISYQALSPSHESWMRTYNRRYPNERVKEERYKIYAENVKVIDSFNQENHKFTLKANKFADLTQEEFTKTYTNRGLSYSFHDGTTDRSLPANYSNRPPRSIDWRNEGAVTGVKDQGKCGSCWAFSAVATIEGIFQIKTGKLTSLSEQELVDCVRPRNKRHTSCDSGSVKRAFEFVIHNGSLTTEDNYRYKGVPGACNFTLNSATFQTQAGGVTIRRYERANNETELLAAVAKQPVSVSVSIPVGNVTFFHLHGAGVVTDIGCGPDDEINHSMTAVGYGTENGIDYWLLKNSYGKGWGDNGYIKMARGVNGGICKITKQAIYPVID